MRSCWVVRPRDRPSFKDVVVSIRELLYTHDEDESDSDHAMDTGRHETSASATGHQDIESRMEETSFSRPGRRIHQASTHDDGPVTHHGNEDPEGEDMGPPRDEQELESGVSTCQTSNRAEYLVIIESPMLSSCEWILEV